jgi:hypothetical protein
MYLKEIKVLDHAHHHTMGDNGINDEPLSNYHELHHVFAVPLPSIGNK